MTSRILILVALTVLIISSGCIAPESPQTIGRTDGLLDGDHSQTISSPSGRSDTTPSDNLTEADTLDYDEYWRELIMAKTVNDTSRLNQLDSIRDATPWLFELEAARAYESAWMHSRVNAIVMQHYGSRREASRQRSSGSEVPSVDTLPDPWVWPWPINEGPLNDPRYRAIVYAEWKLQELFERPWRFTTDMTEILTRRRRDLDNAIFLAYGWPADLSDEEILERLYALRRERSIEESK